MEIMYAEDTNEPCASLIAKCRDNFLLVSSNWQIANNKQFIDAITTAPLQHAPARVNCEDVAFLNTCIALQPARSDSSVEPCTLDIKVINCQKIARIAIVSEGSVLEIFKQFGEYETTIFTEFIDEYDENTVFLGETTIQPPTTEISIKFTRTKNKGPNMWIYGIRLFLTDSVKEAKSSAFNYDMIQTFLSNIMSNNEKSKKAELARLLEESNCNKQKILNKNEQVVAVQQKCLESPALDSNHLEYNSKIEKDNNKECQNCTDNHEKTDSFECKSNVDNDKWIEELEMKMKALMESFYNEQKIMNNEQFSTVFQKCLNIFVSNSNHLECKNEIGNNERECLSHKDDHKQTNSFECRCRNVSKESKKDCSSHKEDIKEIEQRDDEKDCSNNKDNHEKTNSFECRNRNVRDSKRKDYEISDVDIRIYIDNKFCDMEKKLMERIDEMEADTNRKLDAILERLEARLNLF